MTKTEKLEKLIGKPVRIETYRAMITGILTHRGTGYGFFRAKNTVNVQFHWTDVYKVDVVHHIITLEHA